MELRKWQLAVQAGAVSPDEIREELLGLKPIMGGLGMLPVQPPQTLEEAINRQIDVATMATIGNYRALDPHILDGAPAKSNGKPRKGRAHV
jgi:hypothetical protein